MLEYAQEIACNTDSLPGYFCTPTSEMMEPYEAQESVFNGLPGDSGSGCLKLCLGLFLGLSL